MSGTFFVFPTLQCDIAKKKLWNKYLKMLTQNPEARCKYTSFFNILSVVFNNFVRVTKLFGS